jgi:hypothetical protein
VAFVNAAAAATSPVVATAPVVPPPATPVKTAPVKTTPVKKPSAPVKTITLVKSLASPVLTPIAAVPVVVAMQSSSDPAVQQIFVAVQNVATETAPIALTNEAMPTAASVASTNIATTAVPTVPSIGTTAATAPLATQSNIVQRILSDPKAMANDFYLFLMVLFLVALVLNIFINIRVQFPRLIAGGLLVIVVAGLCIMLNQDIGLLHAVII